MISNPTTSSSSNNNPTTTTTTLETAAATKCLDLQQPSDEIGATAAAEFDLDEFSPKASRTLYIGNLDRDVKPSDIREKLDKARLTSELIGEIELKKDSSSLPTSGGGNKKPTSSTSSAYVQFSDIKNVVRAIRQMQGKQMGKNEIKVGFGRTKATRTLWLDNINETNIRDQQQLGELMRSYCETSSSVDLIEQAVIDKQRGQALVRFVYVNDARECLDKIRATRRTILPASLTQLQRQLINRVAVDFASNELVASRFESLLTNGNNGETTSVRGAHRSPTNGNRSRSSSVESNEDSRRRKSRNNDRTKKLASEYNKIPTLSSSFKYKDVNI